MYLSVDTHLELHVATLINELGQVVKSKPFSVDLAGYRELLAWCKSYGFLQKASIEGTGSYGAELTKFLKKNSIDVYEVMRPNRMERRQKGKTDVIDSENAARSVLSGETAVIPKSHAGPVESLRSLLMTRNSAVKSRTQAMNQIRALLVSGPDELKQSLYRPKPSACATACLARCSNSREPLMISLVLLAQRWNFLNDQVKSLDNALKKLTLNTAQSFVSRFGVGTNVAATLLVAAGDNTNRLKKESSFSALRGVNPIPVSSGKTTRHRLNRGGSRSANNALWTVAMVRMRSDPRTKDDIARRTAEGLSTKEITRILKRYIARELFPLILKDLASLS
ncbi:IS110 family transposase [Vibrio splendidus]|uniref:Transposase n=1 Tax=Vibrio lentus TaxID=136468 RepID=A0A855ISL1_9VIBR|nr:IS110 family transposase [Vibrio lentus]PHN83506.1 IS110 family transposase [Vibrio splendidus]MCB5361998.1 IS110 family transposase [Vibrio lentus]MCB5452333.1 IS110 family transposase [Vibrio lentus]MCB5464366.1 IS110 family transposase [Vibrio lentus]MCB5464542.1 IS110 family transposase [Vibrio lentus]